MDKEEQPLTSAERKNEKKKKDRLFSRTGGTGLRIQSNFDEPAKPKRRLQTRKEKDSQKSGSSVDPNDVTNSLSDGHPSNTEDLVGAEPHFHEVPIFQEELVQPFIPDLAEFGGNLEEQRNHSHKMTLNLLIIFCYVNFRQKFI